MLEHESPVNERGSSPQRAGSLFLSEAAGESVGRVHRA